MQEKIQSVESNIVIVLDHISQVCTMITFIEAKHGYNFFHYQNISQTEHMPTTGEFEDLQVNLVIKCTFSEGSIPACKLAF